MEYTYAHARKAAKQVQFISLSSRRIGMNSRHLKSVSGKTKMTSPRPNPTSRPHKNDKRRTVKLTTIN